MDENKQVQTREVDIPATVLNQRLKMADEFHKSGAFTGDVKNKQMAFAKIMAGAEMGMGPMEAMNAFYFVNGKLTIYGMALSKQIRQAGWKIEYKENGVESCTVTVTKGEETFSYEATKADMIALKSKAYAFAPKDKLKWHALGRLVRFYIPEILSGTVSYTKEEYEDVPARVIEVKEVSAVEVMLESIEKADKDGLDKIKHDLPKTAAFYDEAELDQISDAIRKRNSILYTEEVGVHDRSMKVNDEKLETEEEAVDPEPLENADEGKMPHEEKEEAPEPTEPEKEDTPNLPL